VGPFTDTAVELGDYCIGDTACIACAPLRRTPPKCLAASALVAALLTWGAKLRYIDLVDKRFGALGRPLLGVVQRSVDIVLPILPRQFVE
jgi:hypothetical protein